MRVQRAFLAAVSIFTHLPTAFAKEKFVTKRDLFIFADNSRDNNAGLQNISISLRTRNLRQFFTRNQKSRLAIRMGYIRMDRCRAVRRNKVALNKIYRTSRNARASISNDNRESPEER